MCVCVCVWGGIKAAADPRPSNSALAADWSVHVCRAVLEVEAAVSRCRRCRAWILVSEDSHPRSRNRSRRMTVSLHFVLKGGGCYGNQRGWCVIIVLGGFSGESGAAR